MQTHRNPTKLECPSELRKEELGLAVELFCVFTALDILLQNPETKHKELDPKMVFLEVVDLRVGHY